MFMLNHHLRASGGQMGDIICLTDIHKIIKLVPQFGMKMDQQLNCDNSLEIPDTFNVNNFSDKEAFHTILSYQ
jgi:hypothetical protein